MRLAGRIALITGSTSGIGEAVAEVLAREGAGVVVTGRSQARGEGVVRRITASGGRATFIAADVRHEREVERLVREAMAWGGHLDILVNSAGITHAGTVLETTEHDFHELIDTNLKSAFFACKHAIPYMLSAGGGRIVNVGSNAGLMGERNCTLYCVAKGGLVQLTRSVALDFARQGITANCVCPAGTDTPMLQEWADRYHDPETTLRNVAERYPINRLARPHEVAEAVLFLVSAEGSYVTGIMFPIDGGCTAGYFHAVGQVEARGADLSTVETSPRGLG